MGRVSEERICEIFLKLLEPEEAASFMLQEGSIRFLVTEEVNQEDVNALKTSLADIKGVIKNITPLGQKVSSLQGFLDATNKAVDKASGFAAALNLQEPEGVVDTVKKFFGGKVDLSKALKAVAKIYSQASTAATTITKAAELLGGELGDLISDEGKDKPLKDAAAEADMDPKLIKQAFTKAFKSSRPGMLARMTDFFKSAGAEIPGAEIPEFPADEFATQAAETLTLNDLINLGQVADEIDEPPTDDLEDIGEAEVGEVITGDEAGDGGDEELTGEDAELSEEEVEEAEDMADQGAGALGSIPFGKMELTSLLKAFPDITGKGNKATKSRRAFRLAVNDAAGTEIFQASFDRNPKQIAVLLEGLTAPAEEDAIISRWVRLAGL